MKSHPCRNIFLTLFSFTLLSVQPLRADEPAAYEPELFESTELVYEDTFDGELDLEHWEIRQGSTWKIIEGVLVGSESPKEFQEKAIARNDKAHAGFKPVIWLKQVPAEFVCTMRVRYDGEDYIRNFPLIDLGHHFHTLTFSQNETILRIKKDVEILPADAPLFSLNEWHDVAIELKRGKLLFSIDGEKYLFESDNIDMGDQTQIDFKGIDFGKCRIDDVRVWRGK